MNQQKDCVPHKQQKKGKGLREAYSVASKGKDTRSLPPQGGR